MEDVAFKFFFPVGTREYMGDKAIRNELIKCACR